MPAIRAMSQPRLQVEITDFHAPTLFRIDAQRGVSCVRSAGALLPLKRTHDSPGEGVLVALRKMSGKRVVLL